MFKVFMNEFTGPVWTWNFLWGESLLIMISIFIKPEIINIVCLMSAVIIYMFQEIFSTSFKLSNLLIPIIVPNILFMFEEFVAICFFKKNSNSSLSLFFLLISLDRSFQRTSHLFTLICICLRVASGFNIPFLYFWFKFNTLFFLAYGENSEY